jgi:hypothetical protein
VFYKILIMGAIALFTVRSADAGLISYFGLDNPGLTSGEAEVAEKSFLSNVTTGVGIVDFEGFAADATSSLGLTFDSGAGSVNATLSGDGQVRSVPTGSYGGRSPISGTKFWDTGYGGDFTVTFDNAVSAFGFYGTDVGDFEGDLVLTLKSATQVVEFVIEAGARTGSVLFWGFTDDSDAYTSVTFTNTADTDIFGFDNMLVGVAGNVVGAPAAAPEPASLAIFAAFGVSATCFRRRRVKRA